MYFWPPYRINIKDQRKEYDLPPLSEVPIIDFLATFVAETSLQGFPQLIKQNGFIKKFIWLIGIGACAAGLYWQASTFFEEFAKWNAKTAVTIATARKLPFPAVTICNNNPTYLQLKERKKRSGSDNIGSSNTDAARQRKMCDRAPTVPSSPGIVAEFGEGSLRRRKKSADISSKTLKPGMFLKGNTSATEIDSGRRRKREDPLSVTQNPGDTDTTLTEDPDTQDKTTTTETTSRATDTAAEAETSGNNAKAETETEITDLESDNDGFSYDYYDYDIGDYLADTEKFIQITNAMILGGKQDEIAKVPESKRNTFGHQLCDMVLLCEYNGRACRKSIPEEFGVWHWNAKYGNCYTFNSGYKVEQKKSKESKQLWDIKQGDNGQGIKQSFRQGDGYGLRLLLNADLERYAEDTTSVGWRIVVHNQTQMPFPEDGGIFVAPGTSTKIAVSMTSMERLKEVPSYIYNAVYSDCKEAEDYNPDDPTNAYTTVMEVDYSATACFKTCYQRDVMLNCFCYDPDYPHNGSAFADVPKSANFTACFNENRNKTKCRREIFYKHASGGGQCDCPQPCQEIGFNYVVSHLKYPSLKGLQRVCASLLAVFVSRFADGADASCNSTSYIYQDCLSGSGHGDDPKELFNMLQDCVGDENSTLLSQISDRFGEVYIYYRDFNSQVVIESESVTLQDLLGWTGGILGLFFGFSAMTMFEYFQLFFDVLCVAFAKLWAKLQKRKDSVMPGDPQQGGGRRPPSRFASVSPAGASSINPYWITNEQNKPLPYPPRFNPYAAFPGPSGYGISPGFYPQ